MTKTGNYLIGGSSFYYSGVDPTSYGGWIILTDNNGNILWQKDLCGGWGYGGIFSAIQASDSGFVATGSTGGIWGSSLIFLAKITPSVTGLEKSGDVVTKDFSLSPNYPNPFNSSTTIGFNLLKTSEVKLKIFNIIGEEVAILVSEKLAAGNYKYKWDAGGLASGIYFYRLEVNGTLHQHKLILMK
jgi:hypothetical protein